MTKINHVLFVDDEPKILDGLRRMLRPMRNEFHLFFAEGAAQALQIMAENDFEVIVSDMRMPGVSGAELLTEVKKKYPHTIRIMLTGQADDQSVMQCINVVHQFIAKPCDPAMLKDVLHKSCALHQLINNTELKAIVSDIETLPSIPSMYEKLQEKLKDPEVVLRDIAEIISHDIAMTAKVLQLVNSSFFGLYQKVDTTERAVSLLGLDTIKALILGVQIFSEMKSSKNSAFINNLWRHSMTVGVLAQKITREETGDLALAGDAFIAGVLHDIGKLIFLCKLEVRYKNVLENAVQENLAIHESENNLLQATHCRIGAYLIGLWGFNATVLEAVAFHHALNDYPAKCFTPALAVHFADVQYYHYMKGDVIGSSPILNEDYFAGIGFEDHLECWTHICGEQFEIQALD